MSLPVVAGGTSSTVEQPVRVTVAVPTFHRVERLRALLPLLLEHAGETTGDPSGRYEVEVLVVDNDPARSAAVAVSEVADPALRYASEPTPGIPAVRNRALAEAASARLLVFIDDDERPEPGWLAHLLRTWAMTGAAGVAGRVRVEAPGELHPWVRAGGFFDRRSLPTGTAVDVAATNNLLLDLDQVRRLGLQFDPAVGLAGGEDSLFTRSLTRAGGKLVWCDESAVVDVLPLERTSRTWVLTRAFAHGNVAVRTELQLAAGFVVRARWTTRGLLRVVGGAGRWCGGVLCRSHRHRARGARAVLRGAGMICGACGLVYQEYTRSGRSWRPARGRRSR